MGQVKTILHVFLYNTDTKVIPDLDNAMDGFEHTECAYLTLPQIQKLNMSSGIKEVLTDVLNFWFFWYIYLTLSVFRCKFVKDLRGTTIQIQLSKNLQINLTDWKKCRKFVKDLTLIGDERYSVVKSKKVHK